MFTKRLQASASCRHFLRFVLQKCQQSRGSGGIVVAKRRTVVTFGCVSSLRVSKVSTVTGSGGVVVAKRRTVVTFGLVLRLRVSKLPTVTWIRGGRGRETQNSRHFLDSSALFCLASGERRGERIEDKREKREERREGRRDRRPEKREKRAGKRERRGKRRLFRLSDRRTVTVPCAA